MRVGQESQDSLPQRTFHEAPTSLGSSQQSSLDTANSQLSQSQPASSGLLDSFQASFTPSLKTPSTSLSNMSSQERVGTDTADDGEGNVSDHGLGVPQNVQSVNLSAPNPLAHRVDRTGAPKRMADGEIKSPGYSLPTSPASPNKYGHSRNSSRTSRGSQIGEVCRKPEYVQQATNRAQQLSSQLKTRLSYAMVKVQHSWQSHNISELEYLTSIQGSPISTDREQRRPQGSPVAKSFSAAGPHQIGSSVRKSGLIGHCDNTIQEAASTPVYRGLLHRDGDDQHPTSKLGASYDSFWRENEGGSASMATRTGSLTAVGPSLAPPVDILPRNQRCLESTNRQLPALHTSDLRNSKSRLLPKTPSPKKILKIRTPSQQAAVEKDAVESLLFMSSPGNSGYHPSAALSGTPLKTEFSSQTVYAFRAGVPVHNQSRIEPNVQFPAYHPEKPTSRRPLSDADIDKMLDEMPDTSSSDDEVPRNASEQRQ